ncbi:MAG: hypothetical protein LBQ60_22140 [Bacteroidales bacterium]|jgi:hypothetical protein|nr:hypothetical protein [Bacteroidales bacterium]
MNVTIKPYTINSHSLFCRFCACICFFLFTVPCVLAQEQDPEKPKILADITSDGKIELNRPVQVDNILKMQIANNALQKGIMGYRIRIFSQSGQSALQKMKETRALFIRNFPDIEPYNRFDSPNYQILVGDFRTKTEALRQCKIISKKFTGAFIVNEIIEIKE